MQNAIAKFPARAVNHARPLTPMLDSLMPMIGIITDTSPLPPSSSLVLATHEVERALAPCGDAVAERAVAKMLCGFPNYRPEAMYIATLIDDLAAYPADAVVDATTAIRRQQKFAPAHGEVLTAVNEIVRRRHQGRRLIARAEAEIQRRADAAAKQAQLDREEADRIGAIEQSLRLQPGTFEPAERFMRWNRPMSIMTRWARAQAWEDALRLGEPWAVETLHKAALLVEIVHTAPSPPEALRAACALQEGAAAARSIVSAWPPDSGCWRHLSLLSDWSKDLPPDVLVQIEGAI